MGGPESPHSRLCREDSYGYASDPQAAAPEWQAAIGALILVAEKGDPMLSWIAVKSELNRNAKPKPFTEGKDKQWGKRKLKRGQ